MAFEGTVEPAADHTGGIASHLGVAGTALAVVFATTLLVREIVEEAAGCGGGLGGKVSICDSSCR